MFVVPAKGLRGEGNYFRPEVDALRKIASTYPKKVMMAFCFKRNLYNRL